MVFVAESDISRNGTFISGCSLPGTYMRRLFGRDVSLLWGSMVSFGAIILKTKKPCAKWQHGLTPCSLRRNDPDQVQGVRQTMDVWHLSQAGSPARMKDNKATGVLVNERTGKEISFFRVWCIEKQKGAENKFRASLRGKSCRALIKG